MRILGIDPGFKATGYGFIECQNRSMKVLEAGTIEPKIKDNIQNRILKIYLCLDQLLVSYKPDILVLEQLYAHYKHPATASKMGHVRGVICLLCAQKNIKLVEYSVKRIRKAICGNGNATKAQVSRIVGHTFKIDERKLPLDATDALGLALAHIYMGRLL